MTPEQAAAIARAAAMAQAIIDGCLAVREAIPEDRPMTIEDFQRVHHAAEVQDTAVRAIARAPVALLVEEQ